MRMQKIDNFGFGFYEYKKKNGSMSRFHNQKTNLNMNIMSSFKE